MSMDMLYTDCLHKILSYLTEPDVIRFGEVFKEHQDSIDLFWKSKTHLNIDYILSKDAGVLPQVLEQCCNLKKLTFTKVRMDNKFVKVFRKVALYCRSLEVLELPEMFLTTEDLESLNTLTTLKRINFETRALDCSDYDMNLLVLFTNNPKLEEVRLTGKIIWYNLEKIPKTVKKFELLAMLHQQSSLLSNLATWKLEKLTLDRVMLRSEDILTISKQSTLRSVDLKYIGNKNELEPLFLNNPNLEEVSLFKCTSELIFDYSFLRKLPKSVKKFSFFHNTKVEDIDLFEYLDPSNMEELRFEVNLYTLLSELPIQAPNLKVLELDCENCTGENLEAVQHLRQLKSLQLNKISTRHGDAITALARNCLELETLTLSCDTQVATVFQLETFSAIAALPKLWELKLEYINGSEHFSGAFFSELSKNQCLSSVKIRNCTDLTNQDVLQLVKGCSALANVVILRNPKITKMLVPHSSAELFKQVNRRTVLYMALLSDEMPQQYLNKVRLHRFMEVALLPTIKW